MPYEMDNTTKPPQISEMFQKFALAFKTKTFEFFTDDHDHPSPSNSISTVDDPDGFSLLDSTEDFITDQKVVVIKPDPLKTTPFSPQPPKTTPHHFNTTPFSPPPLQTTHSLESPVTEKSDTLETTPFSSQPPKTTPHAFKTTPFSPPPLKTTHSLESPVTEKSDTLETTSFSPPPLKTTQSLKSPVTEKSHTLETTPFSPPPLKTTQSLKTPVTEKCDALKTTSSSLETPVTEKSYNFSRETTSSSLKTPVTEKSCNFSRETTSFSAEPLKTASFSAEMRELSVEMSNTVISSMFATISSFEASYVQLQTAHVPFVEENVKAADRVLVSQLERLSEVKKFYRDWLRNPVDFKDSVIPVRFCLGGEVEENQNKLRTLGTVSNRLQLELEMKHDEVLDLRRKLDEIHRCNVRLSKRLCGNLSGNSSGDDVLLTVRVFDSVLHDASREIHKFTKILIGLMRKAGWDLDVVANAVHPEVNYAKKGHNQFAVLSYVCLVMFQGFDLEDFGMDSGGGVVCDERDIGDLGSAGRGRFLKELLEHVSSNPMELLSIHPSCEFSKFCEQQYERLVHPTMESSIFVDLDGNETVLKSWRSISMFYEAFVRMASSVWTLHKLSHAFDPVVEIFQVQRDVDFSMVYMEDITRSVTWPNKRRAKVGFTVVPGFKIGEIVIQSQVYLNDLKCTD